MTRRDVRPLAVTMTAYASLGFQIALTMALCVWGGLKADQWLETDPWLLLCSSIVGVVLVMVRILYVAKASTEPRP